MRKRKMEKLFNGENKLNNLRTTIKYVRQKRNPLEHGYQIQTK